MKFYHISKRLKTLLEMSDTRNDAIDYLRDQARPYATHICKYILWASQNINWENDWSDEIFTFLKNVTGRWLKGNKRLKKQDYLNNFFYKEFEAEWEMDKRLAATIKECIQRYKYPQPDKLSSQQAFEKYKNFVQQVNQMVVDDNLEYQKVKEACKLLKFT